MLLSAARAASVLTVSGAQVDDTATSHSRAETLQQTGIAKHHLRDFFVIANGDDDEPGCFAEIGRRVDSLGARQACCLTLLLIDVASDDPISMTQKMLRHGKPHSTNADDTDAPVRYICH